MVCVPGLHNSFGKLPYTVYQPDYINEVSLADMVHFASCSLSKPWMSFLVLTDLVALQDMTKPPGRTYRYYTGVPLYPFGYGLSYTNFSLEQVQEGPLRLNTYSEDQSATISVKVTNIGNRAGDEVVFAFMSRVAPAPSPTDPSAIKQLFGFERVTLEPGASTLVTFSPTLRDVATVREDGAMVVSESVHRLSVSKGHGDSVTYTVHVNGSLHTLSPAVKI